MQGIGGRFLVKRPSVIPPRALLFKARGVLGGDGNPSLDPVIRAKERHPRVFLSGTGIHVSVSGSECPTQGGITS